MGKSTIDGPFSIAMLNYQRVYIYILLLFIVQHRLLRPGMAGPNDPTSWVSSGWVEVLTVEIGSG